MLERAYGNLVDLANVKRASDGRTPLLNEGGTPLHWASWNGRLEVVKFLVSIGCDKEARDNYGRTPLHCASSDGHHEIVKFLVSIGCDKEALDYSGRTPLHYASVYGHLEVVKYLR